MKNQYLPCLLLPLLLVTGQTAFAQAPTITAISPARNLRNAPATTNVAITFDQPISSGTATLGAVRVFSQQRGGLLRNGQGGSTSASGNTLTFDPTTNFRPGETILTTVSSQAQSSGGANLARGQVHQFTVGVGGTGRGHFTAPATNPNPAVGDDPQSVALGDVDRDGDLDLLTANFSSANVSVRLNDGSGHFTPHPTNPNPAVGAQPYSVALGDVDGDGDLDLLTANYGSHNVSVLLNDGSGHFTAHPTNPNPDVGSTPASVALGDVDGDGDLDLLTANNGSNTVSVRLNDGSGNFTAHPTNPNSVVGAQPVSVALGDVDGDGDLDLLTADLNSANVSISLNDGSGNFTAHPTNPNPAVGAQPISVALGDVDGDGDLDLLTANSGSDNVSVRLNDGSGNFTAPATNPNPAVGSFPVSVAIGDVDGDGDLDLLTANYGSHNVSVLLNDGSGHFTDHPTNPNPAVGSTPASVAMGDVDGDGDLDLLTASAAGDNVSVRLNQPLLTVITALSPTRNLRSAPATTNVAITFNTPISSGTATLEAVRVFSQQRGGLLRDGQGGSTSASGNTLTFDPTTNFRPGETILTTVTSQAQSSQGTSLARGQVHQFTVGVGGTGVGNFIAHPTNPNPAVGSRPESVAMGDVDGDGDLDLLTANSGSNTVSMRLNNGSGTFTAHPTNPNPGVGDGPQSVALGDVDGDGDLDLLTANAGSDNVSVLLNNGSGTFTPHPTNPNPGVGDAPVSVAMGDVDGDGDLDLLTANIFGDNVSVRLNDGSGNFTPHPTNPNPAVGDGPGSVVLGDVDGDGDLDLLTANSGSGNVSVRLNDGSGTFTAPATNPNPAVGDGPRSVALGDVDGDGDLDLLTANINSDNVSVRLNDGSGKFTPHPTNPNPAVGSTPQSVVLGDVDGDGDLDLLTANFTSDNVSVRLNDGLGNFTPATNPSPAVDSRPGSVALGDVDGDGDLDLLTANAGSDNVSVRLNQPPSVPLVITTLSPARNGRNAPPTTNVAITFNTPLSSGSATLEAVRVFSQQRGGLLRNGQGGSTSVSGNTLTFDPTLNFRPGETILTTVTSQAQSSAGGSLARGQVHQFTVGVGGTGGGHFTAHPSNPTVGDRPRSVALGDVDGDGYLDLLTANANSDNVSVRLNNSAGYFTAHPTNPNPTVGSSPRSVVLGDVDRDGDLDLLTANEGSANVSVRLNNGSGNFTPPATNPNPGVGDAPVSVALGDVDGDGDLDLLTANDGGHNTVSVRLNDGSGNFTAPATNPNPTVGSSPRSVALGDVDGDGDLDLLTANFSGDNVSVRLNDGSGNFTAPATNPNPGVGDGPQSVALGDVDGDGDLDLLTANLISNSVSVRLNNGSGNFTPPATNPNPAVGSAPLSVALGDVDGDGDLDLLTANFSSANVSVRLNNGSGHFTPPATNPNPAVSSGPESVAVGDVDGDGDLDLLTANINSDNVSVLLNTVNAVNAAPVATANANQTATVGVAFAYTVNAFTDAESPNALTYSASITPANGLSFDPATRVVSGTPTSPGASTVRVTATDPGGLSANTDFSITTRCPDLTAIINPSSATLSCANPTVSLTASGGESYRWEDNSTSAIRSVSTGGTYSVTVTAVGGCTASAQITVTGNATDGLTTYYADADGDGFGNPNSLTSVCASTPPAGFVTNNTDCDDTRKLYADGDGDGFGAGPAVACGVATNTDCNDNLVQYADTDSDGFGSTTKVNCNGVTNNTDCDDTRKLYADGDGDGVGAGPAVACGVATNTDCNDSDVKVSSPQTYYADTDGDGFGNPGSITVVCSSTPPAGYVTDKSDCDDTKKLYADGDGDGFGAGPAVACGVATNTDCNDRDAAVFPSIITAQPTSLAVEEKQAALFSVNAKGTSLTYQWYYNGTAPANELKKETSATLSLKSAKSSDAGTYYVRVTGVCGSVLSAGAVLSVSSKKARMAAAEEVSPLRVIVLGNPVVGDQLEVEVTGAEGTPLQLQVIDPGGRVITQQHLEQAGVVELRRLEVGSQPAGLLLLRVSTPTWSQVVKVVKQ